MGGQGDHLEGMILAAGAGTRLRPLTNDVPKALVEVGSRPMMAWVMERMVDAGVQRLVVNTHHHEEQIRTFLEGLHGGVPGGPPENAGVGRPPPPMADARFEGLEIAISPEAEGPLDTGGGLFKAAPFFSGKSPILLHNVDVISEIDLTGLVARHREATAAPGRVDENDADSPSKVVATLAVQDRGSTRNLLFDDLGLLGWENRGCDHARDGRVEVRDSVGKVQGISFAGIHVLEPAVFGLSERTGAFSIITLYLELAQEGWVIRPVDVTGQPWFDIGTPEKLEAARKWMEGRKGLGST